MKIQYREDIEYIPSIYSIVIIYNGHSSIYCIGRLYIFNTINIYYIYSIILVEEITTI